MAFIQSIIKRPLRAFFGAVAVSGSLLLAGCGGGEVSVSGEIDVVVPPVQVIAFDLGMSVDGQPLSSLRVFPGESRDVPVYVGERFEISSSGPVAWTVVVGGSVVDAPAGSSIFYNNANIYPTLINNARYAASTGAQGFLPSPVVMTLIATSLDDSRQEAQINVVLKN